MGTRRPSLTRLLSSKNAADLNVLLANELSLSESIIKSCTTALKSFVQHLKSKLDTQNEFNDIIIGGSMGTQTEINSEDDVDATLHIMYDYGSDDVTQAIASFRQNLANNIASLEEHVKAYGKNAETDEVQDAVICCTLLVPDCPVDVEIEILPSLLWDVHDADKREKLYEKMIESASDRRFYATSLCVLQINYIKTLQNTRVRNLIRLVKFWLQRAFSVDDEKCRLPSAYSLQFLVISLWETAGRPETFKPSVGFRAIMEAMQNYSNMYITWSVYYSKDKIQRALVNQRRPILMDPCDPTKNYASECNCWNDVATVAVATLGKPMIQDVTPNPRWQ
ncbi:2'-5'-oligoadenylate synthase 2-like [Dendronephthya gigantea]|uniref:2'-5'-oligoadenylate synthase 2-like n=1 Tax=Dendronephthya gigantea TaxID=151771 RepID=UPI00106A1773|nr:2'-5'-oligoadenylate synthase 2-like [Dendronephthya gigantea]